MRVIAGEFRSRMLKPVPGFDVRPTSDRLRETLFNVLAPRIEGSFFIDAYSGSGAIGIEAVSRGAARVVMLERNKIAIGIIRDNVKELGIARRVDVVHTKAASAIALYPADIVFLDPPYDLLDEYEACLQALAAKPPSLVVAEHSSRVSLQPAYGPLQRTRVLKQGDSSLSFYSPVEAAKEEEPEVSSTP